MCCGSNITQQKSKTFAHHMSSYFVLSPSSVWNTLFELKLHLSHLPRSPRKAWAVSPKPPPSLLKLPQLSYNAVICSIHKDKKKALAWRCLSAPRWNGFPEPTELLAQILQSPLVIEEWWAAPSRWHPLQSPAALWINEPKVHKDFTNVSPYINLLWLHINNFFIIWTGCGCS